MQNKSFLIFLLSLMLQCPFVSWAQSEIGKTLDIVTKKTVINLLPIFSDIQSANDKQVMVLPFYNSKKEITDISERLTNKIANQLNIKLYSREINFNARSYYDKDPLLTKIWDSLRLKPVQGDPAAVEKYYRGVAEALGVDYVITGSYNIYCESNKIKTENTKIFSNPKIGNLKTISIQDQPADLDHRYGWRAFGRSFIPSFQQFHCGRKVAGSLILTSLLITGVASGVSWYEYDHYYDLAEGTNNIVDRRNYLSKSDNWKTAMKISIASAGLVYLCNILDGSLNKKGLKDKCGNQYSFTGNIEKERYLAGLTINFK